MWEIAWALIWHFGTGALGICLVGFCDNFKVQLIGTVLVSIFILLKPW